MKPLHTLYDARSECFSVICESTVGEYLGLIRSAYDQQGDIEGQRARVNTKTAKTIRKRMVEDIEKGAILPPVVIGYVGEDYFKNNDLYTFQFSEENMKSICTESSLSIIDGMQRTSAYYDACERNEDVGESKIRIEFWVAKNSNNLLYRMLVLNTGQIPWNLRRQIELVYRPIIKDIQSKVTCVTLIEQEDKSKRTKAGEYPADKIIELYIAFGKRSNQIDTREETSDEFSRLDFINSTANNEFNGFFFEVLRWMCEIDKKVSKFEQSNIEGKFKTGKDLFNSQPARIGFVTALSINIMDFPGLDRSLEEQEDYFKQSKQTFERLNSALETMDPARLEEFLDYETLNERLLAPSTKVGTFEREFFTKSFQFLFKELKDKDFNDSQMTLTPCWRK